MKRCIVALNGVPSLLDFKEGEVTDFQKDHDGNLFLEGPEYKALIAAGNWAWVRIADKELKEVSGRTE